jgi:hypothetical protein
MKMSIANKEKPMRNIGIPVIVALLFAAPSLQAADSNIDRLAWLGGCWQAEGGEAGSMEHWLPLAGGSMMGVGRTVKQGKTVAYEFMQIREQADGTLVFHAQPSGKPPNTFTAIRVSDTEVVFENLQHDFPQRVAYARDGANKLNARIEGTRNGQLRVIPFPMVKVSCDALLPQR